MGIQISELLIGVDLNNIMTPCDSRLHDHPILFVQRFFPEALRVFGIIHALQPFADDRRLRLQKI